jgi:uncharacterized membrane protein
VKVTENSQQQLQAKKVVLVSACCAALATLAPVAFYQTGLISHLPDPPLPIFQSERIVSSKAAHPIGVPDSLLGLANFGATLALILLARRSPLSRRLLGAKLSVDAVAAAFNVGRQVVRFRALCFWCTGTSLATAAMVWAGHDLISETSSATFSTKSEGRA